MTRILDGRALATTLREETAREVKRLRQAGARPPGLAAVVVGEDPASRLYVGMKAKASRQAGFASRTVELPAGSLARDVLAAVEGLNQDGEIDGFLVQLPLPPGLPERQILGRIAPDKDVDGFHPVNVGRLWSGEEGFVPATPAGILELLRRHDIPLRGRHAVVVGRSNIVGKPLAALLLREDCTVTVCHSYTRNLAEETRRADLLIGAVGRPALLTEEHVKEGAVVIDVGVNRITESHEVARLFPGDEERLERLERRGQILVGDVDFPRVAPRAEAITPVPGGVGPLTVAMLLANTLKAYKRHLAALGLEASPWGER